MVKALFTAVFLLTVGATAASAGETQQQRWHEQVDQMTTPAQRKIIEQVTGGEAYELSLMELQMFVQTLTCYGGGKPHARVGSSGELKVTCK